MADHDSSRPAGDAPPLRVIDRRWWAKAEPDAEPAADDDRQRKPTYVEELEQRVADHAAHLQSVMAEHKRALEDFEQARLRIRRDVSREVERGKRAILVELLDVLDNLDRALGAMGDPAAQSESAAQLTRGVQLVRDQFLAKLEGFGVTRLAALGQPFDAMRHEAVTVSPVTDPGQDGVVLAVIREGYAIGDELLRPASVVVGQRTGA